MILPIENTMDWELIRQRKYTQINKDNIRKNRHTVDHDYKVGDNVMLTNHTAYIYKTPYMVTFGITQYFNNGTVELNYGPTKIMKNIQHIKPYKSDTKFEDISTKNTDDGVNI